MNTDKILLAISKAASKVYAPTYGIFAYRGGEWLMVHSSLSNVETAHTYASYAISGRWGDCLEIRVDGVRVAL